MASRNLTFVSQVVMLLILVSPVVFSKDLVIPSDCKPHAIGKNVQMVVCLKGEPQDRLSILLRKGPKMLHQFERRIDPEGTFNNQVVVQGLNQRFLAIAYDDTECTIVQVIDLSTKKTVVDTGCHNSSYCTVKRFPTKSDPCKVAISCGEGKSYETRPYKICDPKNKSALRPKCRVTGCSSQLCAAEDTTTICMWHAQFACYRTATCEIQENGRCGWTMTKKLKQCLKGAN